MIELPEAASLADQIARTVGGRTITGAEANHTPHKLMWFFGDPGTYRDLLVGRTRLHTGARTPRRPRSPRASGSLPVASGSLPVASRPLPPPCPRSNNTGPTGLNRPSEGWQPNRAPHAHAETSSYGDHVPPGETALRPVRRSTHPRSYTHLRAHETRHDLVCRLLLEKKKKK